MAVYTKINQQQILDHLKNYSIGKLVDLIEIIDGIDNSNFILQTNFLENNQQKIINKKFILTIFEKRIDEKDLPFFINLKLHLAKKGINCPFPILDNKGEVITKIANKNSVIVSFLEGKTLKPVSDGYYESITVNHCKEVGSILAKMHVSALDFSQKRINDLSVKNFSKLFAKFSDLVDQYHHGLKAEITENIKFVESFWIEKKIDQMPSAPVHLDLFPDNVFFKNDQLSGVIDFYFSANDLLIYDLAIVVNAWCFDRENFNQNKFITLVDSYKKLRNINKNEEEFLEIALLGASIRFLLTRLNDMFFTEKNSLVKIKDPMEYLHKMRFFKNKIK
jgi:homoserine kinase type II